MLIYRSLQARPRHVSHGSVNSNPSAESFPPNLLNSLNTVQHDYKKDYRSESVGNGAGNEINPFKIFLLYNTLSILFP